MVIVGGLLFAAAALLAGTSGFGLGLLATPALLLTGYPLSFVVTVNLLGTLATRITVAWRLRASIDRRRVGLLVGGAVPGLWIGSRTLELLDEQALKVGVGTVIALAALGLAWADRHPPRSPRRGLTVVAGFLGGVLGTTTSLVGIPPALLLARRRVAAISLFADLAVYFCVAAAIGLAALALVGRLSGAGLSAFAWWLPGLLAANLIGTGIGLRLPAAVSRRLTLALAFVAAVVTVVTA